MFGQQNAFLMIYLNIILILQDITFLDPDSPGSQFRRNIWPDLN